ncbi:MAG: VanZ family protein [Lachnospiraceae bacterium]|nr:VanZ family protein [Lachnospiraceae bacterium]
MNRKKRNILIILICILLTVMWGHSMMSGAVSEAESSAVRDFLEPVLELFVGKGSVTGLLVRKLAHFTEFMLLGLLTGELLHTLGRRGFFSRIFAFLCCMAAAVIDESIQIFSDGRGAQVQDVLLDCGGALAGLCLIGLIHLAAKRLGRLGKKR